MDRIGLHNDGRAAHCIIKVAQAEAWVFAGEVRSVPNPHPTSPRHPRLLVKKAVLDQSPRRSGSLFVNNATLAAALLTAARC
jgi:hypothetical protein